MKRLFNTLFLFLLGGMILAQTSGERCSDDRAYLGIYSTSVSEEKAAILQLPQEEGSLITEVLIGGAADRAGLRPFDFIYGIDEYRTSSRDDLTDLLVKYKAGDQANIHLIRDGRPMTINLILGRASDSIQRERDSDASPFLGISNRDSDKDDLGILINVIDNSTADAIGLQSGDKVLLINGFPMIDWSDVTTAINDLEVGNEVVVTYERDGRKMEASGRIQSRERSLEIREKRESVENAFFGILSQTISQAKAKKLGFENAFGSYVSAVIGNTAAERAGIMPFDYIYGVDEYRTGEGQSLTNILHRYQAGDRAVVHFVRRSQDRQVQVTFGNRDEARREKVDECEGPYFGIQSSHSYVERTGVSVKIIPKSTAQIIGMKDQDLIVRINGYPMIDWEDVGTAIDNMKVGTNIEVKWIRNGREMSGRAPIMSYCQTKTNQIVPQTTHEDLTRRAPGGIDLDNVEVVVSDIRSEEAVQMSRLHKVQLSAHNQINMRSIRIATRPAKGVFQLSFVLPEHGRTIVRIYNDVGRNIYEYYTDSFTGEFKDEIDLSQNGIGTYYLHVQQNGKSTSKRLILRKG
ncbi:PDZ domain-containing protein [Flavilitoribacter nigricans]|uniref:PDZ domain-containing protein n=1 Tax=Flavilitoribacter nigricans (strain ATCC 23147 / DSM 23189 / NBRC 102662 / NCIMB 1420 / SS-2) TaxID=1122177 RepID=A0A2D0MZ50_FLAN2|nr:PDZ domain-containing protein [Flavilitoribacter nigricans]PHN01551.1 hypothetical protein CRP01_36745 [Flavilitoribacter nigricans DSM 23189 = NBRC 102662]